MCLEEKKFFLKKIWKKSPSRPFLGHWGGEQETTFYLRVALGSPGLLALDVT